MSAVAHEKSRGPTRQSDALLWIGAGLVAVLGGTWLVLTEPWSENGPAMPAPTAPTAAAPAAAESATAISDAGTGLDNPLRMAQLAFDAGMLIEPEEYSAWALYRQVLRSEPGNADAAQGMRRVADELIRRGQAALEQGRVADARSIAERITADLPAHDGALALLGGLDGVAPRVMAPSRELLVPTLTRPEISARQPAPTAPTTPDVQAPAERPAPTARPAERTPAAPRPDPVATAFERFEAALAANRLLTPQDASAKHFATELVALDAAHAQTTAARQQLSREFLARGAQALGGLDTAAATTWIDEAELLGVDPQGVAAARAGVTDRLAAMEAARPLPASALKVIDYVAPEYPERALLRGVTGWVDIEFTVAIDGTTKNITVAGASHDNLFRREAAAAVERWRFEPRMFMERLIEQRSYTRIRFVQ